MTVGISRFVNAASMGRLKLGWWSCPYQSAAAPIIIGGAPRTGTTLLRVILDNHPDVWIGPENGVFQEAGRNLPGMEACLDVPIDTLRSIHRRSCCLGEFVDLSMAHAVSAKKKPIWGIKSPSVVHALDTVFHFFPRARFVHLLRDGRDVVCSLRTHPRYRTVEGKRVPTGIVNAWDSCVKTWVDSTTAGVRWRAHPNYYEVKYEDLVQSPRPTMTALLEWLRLPPSDEIWLYHERPLNQGIDSPHPGIEQPVYSSAMTRWAKDLTPEAQSAFTDQACRLLVSLGYAPDAVSWRTAQHLPAV
jgi:hypothetical protein